MFSLLQNPINTAFFLCGLFYSCLILTVVSMFASRMSLTAVRMCDESQEKRLQGNDDT